jgi:hypothetical protein
MGSLGLFFFLAAGAVGLFAFLSVGAWAGARSTELIARERFALYRKLAESPAESARLVLDQLREEDARQQADLRRKRVQSVREARQGGVLLIAVGVGLGVFLKNLIPGGMLWMVGVIPGLIGLVLLVFTFLKPPADDAR